MGKYTKILREIQEERITSDNVDYKAGLECAEKLIFDEQEKMKANPHNIWYQGSPNDLKPNNSADYILILKAHFNSDDGIENGHIYITTDYWDGSEWEGYQFGENEWELLYFCKLKWVYLPLPPELGIKRSDALFIS